MDTTDILIRTDKGELEITTNVSKLPIKHRSVLIMIDGKNSEQNLQTKLSSMLDGKTIIKDLEAHGFIGRKVAPKPVIREQAPILVDQGSALVGLVSRVKEMVVEYEQK